MSTKDFLLEIGCEELPAKGLFPFINQLKDRLSQELQQAHLSFETITSYATPRRLALLVKSLITEQADRQVEKRGPAINAPEKALQGFLNVNKTTLDQLTQRDGYYYFQEEIKGEKTEHLLPQMVSRAIAALTNIKMMAWGAHPTPFLRPVHWVVMLYGTTPLQAEILGVKTVSHTFGHRYHHPQKISLPQASDYEDVLFEEGFVQADFHKRKEFIRDEIKKMASTHKATLMLDEDLLEEVTGLVEWPVALLCQFPKTFLSVPKEALVSSIQHHQKCFPLYNKDEKLHPYFISISNIQSQRVQEVIAGNERVMRARLSDAAFFYAQDQKTLLGYHLKTLEKVIFHQKLGSVADKVKRIVALAEKIAEKIQADKENTRRAAILCKADLMTQMVGEFPELQGTMGEYYAKLQGESDEVAAPIREHYLPRFAGDVLPKTPIGCVLALADRLDTINSIFKIGEMPTGEKDPLGLRRAATGIIRIITEKELDHLLLSDICETEAVKNFILERLPAYYSENKFSPELLKAVLEVQNNNLADIYRRIVALQAFSQLPEAQALSEANKRVKNILKKNTLSHADVSPDLFEFPAEKNLHKDICALEKKDYKNNYKILLQDLASLNKSVDEFFASVMVEVDNEVVKQNRLHLLKRLRELFLNVADISLLSPTLSSRQEAGIQAPGKVK